MYNLNISLFTLNDESIALVFIYVIAIVGIIYMATKKVKIKNISKSIKEVDSNQEEKISVSNYTLAFDNTEVYNNLPTKKVSVITKGILVAFSCTFTIIPFYSFVETLNPVEIQMVMCCICF